MAKANLRVTIASVGEQLFDDEAISVLVPGSEGQMQILANHEPLISTLKAGTIVVDVGGDPSTSSGQGKQEFKVEGGVLEVSANRATILVS